DLNIEIPSGKSVAFIGRNGAGKSTLLRMIGGIDRPDSGKIITNKT
ncbi:ATP-binding cassette domain-containing protein, partial [Escherichia coli]